MWSKTEEKKLSEAFESAKIGDLAGKIFSPLLQHPQSPHLRTSQPARDWTTELDFFTTNGGPPVVENLAASDVKAQSAVLIWDESVDPNADQVIYRIQWVLTGAGWGAPNETTTTDLTTTLTGLAAGGVAYDVRIRAEDPEPLVSNWATANGLVTTIAPPGRGMRVGVGR